MSVQSSAAHGVAWNMVFGIGSRVVTLLATLLLTRFIAPDQYGAVLTASIAVLTVGVITSFAFGQYLIARNAPPDVAFQAATVHFSLGVLAMAVLYLMRVPIGDVLNTPEMVPFIAWYAVAHMIDRARYVPEVLLFRDLQFRVAAKINAVGELVFAVVALALAWRWGVHAIVMATLVRAAVVGQMFFAAAPRAEWLVYAPLRSETVRALLGYGAPIMVAAVADRAATRWDNLIVSRLFGPGIMALYNLAYSLAEMPISNVAIHIGDVLMPSFARLEERERRSAVVAAGALMAIIVCPLGIGLGAVAPTLVTALFDARWHAMAPMLTVLSVMTVFRPMTWAPVAYLQAVQRTQLIMMLSFARAVVVLPLVGVFGYLGGPVWACVGACIGYALHSVATIVAAGHVAGFPIASYLLGVLRPLIACAPMFMAVAATGRVLTSTPAPSSVVLTIQIVIGGLVYVGGAFIFARSTMFELIRLANSVRHEPVVNPESTVNR